ncbi:serine/threonine-protein kinase [Halorubrum ezzemoulense]|nr:serine/threonine-protein kinase [Halorubrum ezzemoulense]MDB2245235.1 serine/threonine-protein kinase [Halorubrum ezzemoulense]MDB2290091.1 serine/threonine-protein kinase [Halorubrum ezzemoulense]MDB2297561.1 serine/threonine-protein kinase [Halorubrum ezzemoulense]MDB2301141.1 serine/threonine-protein kinase [Halorubrum ezzemoulense]
MTLDPQDYTRVPSINTPSDNGSISLDFSEFTIEDRIGEGGNAIVYEATVETDIVDRIAIKKITWEKTITRTKIDEFSNEANAWQRVHDHPYIATVYGFGTDPEPWLATEYLDEGDLSDRIPLEDPLEALWIGSTVADAVQHAHHRGTTHLDLKPSNVLVEKTGTGVWDRPKVIDWGLATPLEDRDGPNGLSPSYAPPEQVDPNSEHEVGPLADVYQLGALVYALLTGEPPRRITPTETVSDTSQVVPPSAVSSSVPGAVDSILTDALAVIPTERIRTAAQFSSLCAQSFRELADTETSQSNSSGPASSTEAESSTEVVAETRASPRTPPTQKEPRSELLEDTVKDTTNSENNENPQTPDTSSDRWYTPREHPTAISRSLSQRLQAASKDPDHSEKSLADALSSISKVCGDDRLRRRLSIVHFGHNHD